MALHKYLLLLCFIPEILSADIVTSGSILVHSGDFVAPATVDYSITASDGVTLANNGERYMPDAPYFEPISVCYVTSLFGQVCNLSTPHGVGLNYESASRVGGIDAVLTFSSTLSTPFTPLVGIDNQVFIAPFTIDGGLAGNGTSSHSLPCQLPDGSPSCFVSLSGSGGMETVTVRYSPGVYWISEVNYSFASVPEPGTMPMLVCGVAVVAGLRRLRSVKRR